MDVFLLGAEKGNLLVRNVAIYFSCVFFFYMLLDYSVLEMYK